MIEITGEAGGGNLQRAAGDGHTEGAWTGQAGRGQAWPGQAGGGAIFVQDKVKAIRARTGAPMRPSEPRRMRHP